MNHVIILILMIYLHIVDDFYLQGILAQLKQKKYWKENSLEKYELYKYDYIAALAAHAFSWTFMIHIPFIFFCYCKIKLVFFVIGFILNCVIHAVVDDLKANRLRINLITDQSIHLLQITITWFVYVYIMSF